jgi:predicted secreted protein with PEFG-CTERM motif
LRKSVISFTLLISTIIVGIYPINAAIRDGGLTENDIEWCEDVFPQYEAAGLKWFLENYHYSIEARVCANLYEDQLWEYYGDDRIQKLVERSKYYVELEIQESEEEAESGKIDVKPVGVPEQKSNSMMKTSADGTILVTIKTTDAKAGQYMGMDVIFEDTAGKTIKHVNYDLRITQDTQDVLILTSQHSDTGISEHWTRPLSSDSPVDVEVTILGIGLLKDRTSWTGPNDGVVDFYAVPEFGSLAPLILVIAVVSIITLSTKSRLMSKL